MFYKIMNGVQKNWLEEFLGKRNFSINDVNGTHLYHYNLKNDEYEQLQKLLQNCTDLLYRKEISFTELTKKLPYYLFYMLLIGGKKIMMAAILHGTIYLKV